MKAPMLAMSLRDKCSIRNFQWSTVNKACTLIFNLKKMQNRKYGVEEILVDYTCRMIDVAEAY